MKENQIESCEKCSQLKSYEWQKKKASHADLFKKGQARCAKNKCKRGR